MKKRWSLSHEDYRCWSSDGCEINITHNQLGKNNLLKQKILLYTQHVTSYIVCGTVPCTSIYMYITQPLQKIPPSLTLQREHRCQMSMGFRKNIMFEGDKACMHAVMPCCVSWYCILCIYFCDGFCSILFCVYAWALNLLSNIDFDTCHFWW